MIKTKDLILDKARFEDWEDLYRNIWSREESARHMLWKVTSSEEDAMERMRRTIRFQSEHDSWTVYEKKSGQAIGWAAVEEVEPGVYEDCGIALGPEYTGQGYGKQIVSALMDYIFRERKGKKMILSCRSQNTASRKTILSCGFAFTHTEERTDPRDGQPYTVEFYQRENTGAEV